MVNRVEKIVGGYVAEKNEYPWQVGITYYYNDKPWCGGSILSSRTILTAALCVQFVGVKKMTVVVGDHDWSVDGDGERRMTVCGKAIHPDYDNSDDYDIAILTLCEDIIFTQEIAPVCPPTLPDSDYVNVSAIITGWGHPTFEGAQPKELIEIEVNTITNTECSGAYGSESITDSMICAGDHGKDACIHQGDSGGDNHWS